MRSKDPVSKSMRCDQFFLKLFIYVRHRLRLTYARQWLQGVFVEKLMVETYANGEPYNVTDKGTILQVRSCERVPMKSQHSQYSASAYSIQPAPAVPSQRLQNPASACSTQPVPTCYGIACDAENVWHTPRKHIFTKSRTSIHLLTITCAGTHAHARTHRNTHIRTCAHTLRD